MRYYNGNFIRKGDNDPTDVAANGVFNLEAQLIHKGENRWPFTWQPVLTLPDFLEVSLGILIAAYMGIVVINGNYDVSEVSPFNF